MSKTFLNKLSEIFNYRFGCYLECECVCVYGCTCAVPQYTCGSLRTNIWLSPSSMCVWGTQLRSPGLEAGPFPWWATFGQPLTVTILDTHRMNGLWSHPPPLPVSTLVFSFCPFSSSHLKLTSLFFCPPQTRETMWYLSSWLILFNMISVPSVFLQILSSWWLNNNPVCIHATFLIHWWAPSLTVPLVYCKWWCVKYRWTGISIVYCLGFFGCVPNSGMAG